MTIAFLEEYRTSKKSQGGIWKKQCGKKKKKAVYPCHLATFPTPLPTVREFPSHSEATLPLLC